MTNDTRPVLTESWSLLVACLQMAAPNAMENMNMLWTLAHLLWESSNSSVFHLETTPWLSFLHSNPGCGWHTDLIVHKWEDCGDCPWPYCLKGSKMPGGSPDHLIKTSPFPEISQRDAKIGDVPRKADKAVPRPLDLRWGKPRKHLDSQHVCRRWKKPKLGESKDVLTNKIVGLNKDYALNHVLCWREVLGSKSCAERCRGSPKHIHIKIRFGNKTGRQPQKRQRRNNKSTAATRVMQNAKIQ